MKGKRPSRPGNDVSHLDKVAEVWAIRIMSRPQWRIESRAWTGSVWNIRYDWKAQDHTEQKAQYQNEQWSVAKLVSQGRNSKRGTRIWERALCLQWNSKGKLHHLINSVCHKHQAKTWADRKGKPGLLLVEKNLTKVKS